MEKKTNFITKLFKILNVNVSHRTRKTIENFLNIHKIKNDIMRKWSLQAKMPKLSESLHGTNGTKLQNQIQRAHSRHKKQEK
jgi:hypothetical protein